MSRPEVAAGGADVGRPGSASEPFGEPALGEPSLRAPALGEPPLSAGPQAAAGLPPLEPEVLSLLVQAMDRASQGIVVSDARGRVILRNGPARQLVRGRDVDLLADNAISAALERALHGMAHEETLDLYSPTRHTLEIRAFPLPGAADSAAPAGAVALVDDVSELRRLEAVRRDFVANLSHELKTPLGALSLLAETLDGEEDPDVVTRLTARVGEEATRFSRIVDDLLDLSRIEAGGTAPLVPVAISAVVTEAMESFYDLAASRSIELAVSLSEGDIHVMGDRRDLVSALANLVDNAIKYSEPGGTVCVSSGREGGHAFVRVQDDGVGIPARDQERVFERFYRVDRARSRSTGGTGLGLAIVRHVAAYHGGEVSVQSTEGEGSMFTLWLPVASPDEPNG